MPKRIEEDEEEFEEEEEDIEEIEEESPKKKKILPPMPKKTTGRPVPVIQQKAPVRRYTAFIQSPAEGIIDAETNEPIALTVWEALANIIERLERIENSIGVVAEG